MKKFGLLMFLLPSIMAGSLFIIPEQKKVIEPILLTKILLASVVTLPYWWLGYRTLKRRVPKEFGIFEDEF